MGIVPKLQAAALKLPLPESAKSVILHAAGPFTIFFWAPTFKWAITFANIGDMKRPAELLSANQQIAIFLTGVLWCRYSFAITPINYNLFVVNLFMGSSAAIQLYRKM